MPNEWPAGIAFPDSKVHVASMGPTWDRQDLGGPRLRHVNIALSGSELMACIINYIHANISSWITRQCRNFKGWSQGQIITSHSKPEV